MKASKHFAKDTSIAHRQENLVDVSSLVVRVPEHDPEVNVFLDKGGKNHQLRIVMEPSEALQLAANLIAATKK